jgi:hypothetical protein
VTFIFALSLQIKTDTWKIYRMKSFSYLVVIVTASNGVKVHIVYFCLWALFEVLISFKHCLYVSYKYCVVFSANVTGNTLKRTAGLVTNGDTHGYDFSELPSKRSYLIETNVD